MDVSYRTGLSRIRNPEYVGANRCLPCTVVNLLITAALVLMLATRWVPVAVAFGAFSLFLIGLRGYLIPGTPTFTRRYLPTSVLRLFGKGPADEAVVEEPFDVGGVLLAGDVLIETAADVSISPAFEAELVRSIAASDSTDMAVHAGNFFDVAPNRIEFVGGTEAWRVQIDNATVGYWESRAAFLIDMAASEAVPRWIEGWDRFSESEQNRTLAAIRACLETCPVCGGAIDLGTEVVRSCCRESTVVAATCDDCNSRLFEIGAESVLTTD